jgi:hypothetical protein
MLADQTPLVGVLGGELPKLFPTARIGPVNVGISAR